MKSGGSRRRGLKRNSHTGGKRWEYLNLEINRNISYLVLKNLPCSEAIQSPLSQTLCKNGLSTNGIKGKSNCVWDWEKKNHMRQDRSKTENLVEAESLEESPPPHPSPENLPRQQVEMYATFPFTCVQWGLKPFLFEYQWLGWSKSLTELGNTQRDDIWIK